MVEEGCGRISVLHSTVRVRRAAGLVFGQEVREHAVLVFGGEVDDFDVNADVVGDADGVDRSSRDERYSLLSSSSPFS